MQLSTPVARSVPAAIRSVLARDRWALAGTVTVLVIGLVAIFADVLTAIEGHDPYTYDATALDRETGLPAGAFGGVSTEHWFGVEPLTGRDLFAIVVHGARTSFLIGLAATLVSIGLGVLIGAAAGYLGGWVDRIITWGADVFLGFPYLVFMIAIGAVVPVEFPRALLLIVVIGFFGWPSTARIVRAQVLTLKERNFVKAARVLGASPWQVFRTELLPNLWGPVLVMATLSVPGKIGLEAALSFLGVGVLPPTPSWGRSISAAIDWVRVDPAYLLFPGLALFAVTWAFNAVGDGLRDALDPRSVTR
ncbi:ABC transporter permease [Lentzea sp. HUAS TT2]|uniref:ABC transporter permease n=1 Tax=Lentzea sp. HUAS TT2 TaxID=3447454 RepID=UPI003F6F9670